MSHVRDLWKLDPDRRGGNGKRWMAVWNESDGRRRTKVFAKKVDAERFAAAQETDIQRDSYIDPTARRMTVSAWCETWLRGYGTRRASTVRQAQVHIRQIEAEFGGMALGAVRPSHVKSWTARLLADGLAPSYVGALHGRLSQVFADAVHDGIVAKSPCSRRTSPGAGAQRPYVATTEQVWELADAVPEQMRAAVLLGAFAGLRVAEACGLRTGNVDFMRGVLHPAVQYPAEPLKTEISRSPIPIAQSMTLQLAAHVQQWPGETVLTNPAGGQLEPWRLERAFRSARAKVRRCEKCGAVQPRPAGDAFKCRVHGCGGRKDGPGLPDGFRFHDLRHYFASLLIADGCDVKTVQARMRHVSAKTTLDTYGHLWPDRDESTRAAVEAVFTARLKAASEHRVNSDPRR